MNVLKQIMMAIKGDNNELKEAIVDVQDKHLFEQAIKDAENSLENAKHDLAQTINKEMQATKKIQALQHDIDACENNVAAALNQDQQALALQIASQIAELESDQKNQQQAQQSYLNHMETLKESMEKTERQLQDHQRQLTMVTTTENVQKATATIADNFTGDDAHLLSAKQSLTRNKQQTDEVRTAQDKLNDNPRQSPEQRSAFEPPDNSAQAVLNRIKNKQANN